MDPTESGLAVTGMIGAGEIAALSAAALWAVTSLFYSRAPLTAWQINFAKNNLATLLLCGHLLLLSTLRGQPMFAADSRTWFLLSVSSVVGILIGDTFYFRSLQILGPRRALIVSTSSPLFATLIGWVALSEPLSLVSLTGILVTLGGIVIVVAERGAQAESGVLFPASGLRGVSMGLAGAVCNAVGAAFSRMGTQGSDWAANSGCDPLEATLIRVGVAAAASLLTALAARRLISTIRTVYQWSALRVYGPAVIFGPWLGIWMSQIAYKKSHLAIAITLTCTTPLFVLPVLRVIYGHRITFRGLAGCLVAILGVYLTVAGDGSLGD